MQLCTEISHCDVRRRHINKLKIWETCTAQSGIQAANLVAILKGNLVWFLKDRTCFLISSLSSHVDTAGKQQHECVGGDHQQAMQVLTGMVLTGGCIVVFCAVACSGLLGPTLAVAGVA
jgi:hypothetical protein